MPAHGASIDTAAVIDVTDVIASLFAGVISLFQEDGGHHNAKFVSFCKQIR